MKKPSKLTLQDFTEEELRAVIRRVNPRAILRKCPLCRSHFKPGKHNQIFDTPNCRVRHWKLEQEIGVLNTKLRLDYLEKIGELPIKKDD